MTPERTQILQDKIVSQETIDSINSGTITETAISEVRSLYQKRLGKTGLDMKAILDANLNHPSARICAKCLMPTDKKTGYCRECHNEYNNEIRPKHSELSEEQRLKANARSYVNSYQRRGLIQQQPCAICACEEGVEKHHPDYSRPLTVTWLCKKCHDIFHRESDHV